MPSTFLQLCNKTIRRLNEVEIAADDFGSVRGIQALVKDAVKDSIARINQAEFEWPFNAAEHTQVLVPGQTEYSWPAFFKISDWNSFQIQKNELQNVGFKSLRYLERDEWYRSHRDKDDEAGAAGRGVPDMVFDSHGNGFGVTPSPDAAYSVQFRYFLNYSDITAASDVTRIPETFDTVIIDGALYYMYMFKDNLEAAQVAYMSFEKGIKDMQSIYINNYESVRDRRVNF